MACGTKVCKYFWCLSVYDIGYDIGTEYYTITNIVPDIVPDIYSDMRKFKQYTCNVWWFLCPE